MASAIRLKVSGHGFSRAEMPANDRGFSHWGFKREGMALAMPNGLLQERL